MATPEEVYNSDTYKSVAEGRQGNHVPLAWFQDVYEALGKVLSAQPGVHPTVLQVGQSVALVQSVSPHGSLSPPNRTAGNAKPLEG